MMKKMAGVYGTLIGEAIQILGRDVLPSPLWIQPDGLESRPVFLNIFFHLWPPSNLVFLPCLPIHVPLPHMDTRQ